MNDNNGEESLVSTLIKEVSGLGQQLRKLKDEEYECTFRRRSSTNLSLSLSLSLSHFHILSPFFEAIVKEECLV